MDNDNTQEEVCPICGTANPVVVQIADNLSKMVCMNPDCESNEENAPMVTGELEVVPDPIIAYVLVRVDAPDFNVGKACAQTHHCGTQMTEEILPKLADDAELAALYRDWKEDRTFGTVLTLAVTAAEMRQTIALANLLGLHANTTHDPTYPIRNGDGMLTAPVDTCAYIFGRKSRCAPAVGRFDLLSDAKVEQYRTGRWR